MTTVLRGWLSSEERWQLCELARRTPGRAVYRGEARSYTLARGVSPAGLLERALAVLPAERGRVDAFYLRYRTGDAAPPHLDERTGWRINVLLLRPARGGDLVVDGGVLDLWPGDAVVFEPCRQVHEVTPVFGVRLVWSVGLVDARR